MPTYEYECAACGHEWEQFQSITASAIRKCPKCGKHKARRLIGTGSSIIFKGSGFYATDYRSESYKKAAKAESEAASGQKDQTKPPESSGGASTDSTKPNKPDKKKSKGQKKDV